MRGRGRHAGSSWCSSISTNTLRFTMLRGVEVMTMTACLMYFKFFQSRTLLYGLLILPSGPNLLLKRGFG